jgi:hypothetical protein
MNIAGVGHASANPKYGLHLQLWVSNPALKPELKGPGLSSHARSAFVSTALQLIEARMLRSSSVAVINAMGVMSLPDGHSIGLGKGGTVISTIVTPRPRRGVLTRRDKRRTFPIAKSSGEYSTISARGNSRYNLRTQRQLMGEL